jgi:hypothetical protein
MQEQLAGRELAGEVARLRKIECAVTAAHEEMYRSRERWFQLLEDATEDCQSGANFTNNTIANETMGAELSIWELAGWRRERARAVQTIQAEEVERAREKFFVSRSERRQIESVACAAIEAERRETLRREQVELDDWSGTRRRMRRYHRTSRLSAAPVVE